LFYKNWEFNPNYYNKGEIIMYQRRLISVAVLAIIQSACSGGSDSSTSLTGASVNGTVPGTVIEAFGDNGSYYKVTSTDNGTARHPFTLDVPANVGFHMVMVTGEGTSDNVVSPIGFRDSSGKVHTRLMLDKGAQVELGHVPLYMSRNEAAGDDADHDGVLDQPLVLDDVGAGNPLSQSDVDGDGINDWDDQDHGGYQYDNTTIDPQDVDDDGVPNVYDADHTQSQDDSDNDGLPDLIDANPHNDPNHNNDGLAGDCDGDGYMDDDQNHDGYHDDDQDHDGYHDDDQNHDGHHDGDDDEDHSCGTNPGSTPPPPGPGKALYETNCTGSSCHGANDKRGKTATQITDAINNVSVMSNIALTADEIQAIADYLAQ